MNELFEKLLAGLRGTSGGTRLIAVLVGTALVAMTGLVGLIANRPHFELAFSGLTDHELAQVCKSLAEAGIAFEQSQPPGPFVLYVDESERTKAYMAAYGSGALDKPLEGILSGGGVSSVFSSAEERAQGVRKREWQEMEKMIEELDFVSSAKVRTAPVSSSSLALGRPTPPTASATIRVTGGTELTRAQADTVANLLSRGLGIAREDLVISDQAGRSLYDGRDQKEDGREVRDMLGHQSEHDHRLALEANAVLEQILGPNKARVSVSSEWDFAQTTLRTDKTEKGTVIQETKTSNEKPVGGAHATAGVSSNTLDPDSPDVAPAGSPAETAAMEKNSEETKTYSPSVAREERVRLMPELKRLSVALFLDESVQQEATKLEAAIKAAVGFDEERRDEFSAVVLPFIVAPEPAPEETLAPEPAMASPLVEVFLRRGVEIVSAIVFLVLLLKTLKGSKNARSKTAAAANEPDQAEYDAELLARVQVEELLKSDPAKVGEILSRWAREEPVASSR